jgi:uncharacterized DUF497 family protein
LRIEKISWDQETVDHILNHLVSPEEVEEVLFNDVDIPLMMRRKEDKYLTYGKTHGGRLLFIVWASKYKKIKIITARDMTEKEKRFNEGGKNESTKIQKFKRRKGIGGYP